MQENESRTVRDTEIRRRLEQIRNCYDVEALQKEASNPQRIASYYRASDFFYNVVHSRGGHVIHMGLSADGVFKKEDFYRQADYVAGLFLPGTRKVLELGAGKAANTKYLAKRFPEISFTALDLPNRNFLRTKVPANVTLIEGDYHDLSRRSGLCGGNHLPQRSKRAGLRGSRQNPSPRWTFDRFRCVRAQAPRSDDRV